MIRLSLLLGLGALWAAAPGDGRIRYACAPCECANDGQLQGAPGKCTACGMALVDSALLGERRGAAMGSATSAGSHDSTTTAARTITPLGDGIWAIRHPDAPDGFPQGNTTVVVGEREALVVDSCYLPSSAREDVEQIRKWTSKPVRWLVNTHWHYDHTNGNVVYADSFPGLSIVAHADTRRQMAGYDAGWFERYPKRTADLEQLVAKGVEEDGQPLSEARRAQITASLAPRKSVGAELERVAPGRLPDVAFEDEMRFDLGGREVEVKWLGLGNTAGDVVVWIPREHLLVAGDLLDHPVPYLAGGFPSELVRTLRRMAALGPQTIVPGHGEVLRGTAYLDLVIDFVDTVVARVDEEVHRVGNSSTKLEEVQHAVAESIDVTAWSRKFAGDDPDSQSFFATFSLPGLVKAEYVDAWRR